jgi:hypothetical protein
MDADPFKFRDSEREEMHLLLGDFGLLESPDRPSDLARRLKAAGLVEEVSDLEPLVGYFLTPAGKAVIRQALG